MDAPEHLWVQARLQLVQRSVVGRPRHLPCNYVNRLIGQRRIDDLFGLHQQESFADLDSHLISSSARHHLYEPLELIVDRTIEVDEPALQDRIDGILDLAWADTTHAWSLRASGKWARVPVGRQPVSLQDELMGQAIEG